MSIKPIYVTFFIFLVTQKIFASDSSIPSHLQSIAMVSVTSHPELTPDQSTYLPQSFEDLKPNPDALACIAHLKKVSLTRLI